MLMQHAQKACMHTSDLCFVCVQVSIQGHHNHICFCVLPVGAPQPMDDAMDSTENRRGQPQAKTHSSCK